MDDYVNFETARLLKEAGFDWYVTEYWRPTPSGRVFLNPVEQPEDINQGPYFSAPTLAQAQKWLRDEWNIHIDACVFGDCSEDADGKVAGEWTFWTFDIYNTESGRQIVDDDEEYDNYEAALSAGIEAALKLIEEGKG